jgi:Flp pilus assembly protein TadB
MEDFMSAASILWLFITAGGAALLAFGLAIGLLTTHRRRESSIAQRLADAATREQYRAEEKSRPDRDAADPLEGEMTVTQVRQGVRGHNVRTVLIASLAATAVAGLVLFMWVEFYPTSVGKHSLPKGAEQRAR